MFFRLLRQSFLAGRRRKVLAVVTVSLAAALITTLFDLSVDVGDKMAREMKSYGSNIHVVPKSEVVHAGVDGVGYNPLSGRDFLDEKSLVDIKEIFWRNNITGIAPFLKTTATIGPRGAVPVIGTYFNHPLPLPDDENYRTGVTLINGYWNVTGRWPRDDASDEALAGIAVAEERGLSVGSRVTLQGTAGAATVVITGILSTGTDEDGAIVAPLAIVQTITGLAGKVQSVEVAALTVPENELSRKAGRDKEALTPMEYDLWYCTAYVSTIAHQIEEAVVNVSARPVWQVASGQGVVIGKIQFLMLVVTIAAFLSAAVGVSSLMNTTITERAKEIGLMKALGAADWEIFLLFLSEATVIGLIGGLVGSAVGSGLSQLVGLTVFGSVVAIPWIGLPVVIVTAVFIALAGSIVPCRAIARLLPVEVLYGRH
ncbi:ABC transporter permease [Telmatospirillum sp.]|uniref:ABC transporter permease n=1 Tax=Telmatospirillum sp. TaxID=2079197 RepID=UPI00284A7099|nr:ABC transporter permease [Telmatospirillum sp.]MDR3435641.1 ABC transporter permease [Telmatospirillum sp.]